MKKVFSKQNIIIGCISIAVIITAILLLCLGKPFNQIKNGPIDCVIYGLLAVIISIVAIDTTLKVFDKNIKFLLLFVFGIFGFWLLLKIFYKIVVFDVGQYVWYLYYIPLLFTPTLWFIINNSLFLKTKKIKTILSIIALTISSILFLLVITNNLHQLVFTFDNIIPWDGKYSYNFGYFIIYGFIFTMMLTTIALFYVKSAKQISLKQKMIFGVVVLLIVVYSIVYMTCKIQIPYLNDMSLVYMFLGTLLVWTSFKVGIVKNSGKYYKFFSNVDQPLAILNVQNQIEYQNTKYINATDSQNYKTEKLQIKNGLLISLEDISKLKQLQKELKEEIGQLSFTNSLLEKKKELLSEQKQLEQKNKLYNDISKNISKKNDELVQMASMLPDEITIINRKETINKLTQIKTLIGYLKRKTSLLLKSYQEELVNKQELMLLFNESINDLKNSPLDVAVSINLEQVNAKTVLKLYDIYNEVLTKELLNKSKVWITIFDDKDITMSMYFIGRNIKFDNLICPKKYNVSQSISIEDDTTIITFKGVNL